MKNLKERLDKANEEFRTWTEHVNGLIAAAESAAGTLHSGTPVAVVIRSYHDDSCGMDGAIRLGVVKFKDRWRIAFSETLDEDPDFGWTPLSDVPLVDRLDACKHLDKLFVALVQAREDAVTDAKQAAQSMKKLIDALPTHEESA